MAASLSNRSRSQEVQSLDGVRRAQAKASLRGPAESSLIQAGPLDRLSRTVKAALVHTHGSGQAAAITLAIDQSQLNRQLRLGTLDLRAMAAGGEVALALLGELLQQEFGAAAKSKKQLAKERLPELLALMLDVVTEDK